MHVLSLRDFPQAIKKKKIIGRKKDIAESVHKTITLYIARMQIMTTKTTTPKNALRTRHFKWFRFSHKFDDIVPYAPDFLLVNFSLINYALINYASYMKESGRVYRNSGN